MNHLKSLLEVQIALNEIKEKTKDVFIEEKKRHPEIVALNKVAENINVNIHSFSLGYDINLDQLKQEMNLLIKVLINYTFNQKTKIFYKNIKNDQYFYAASMFSYINCIRKNISSLIFAEKKYNKNNIKESFKNEIYFSKNLAIKIDNFLTTTLL